VDDRTIEIRRGVYWRAVITVPRSRVQHTDVSQGPLERSFGLGTLVIYTAGTEHAKVSLSGLEHTRALRIREHLLPTEGGDAV
jgi:membrane protein YdbS with pleckstrin-like domain